MSSGLCSWIPSSQTGLVPCWLNTIEAEVKERDESSSWRLRINIVMMSNLALPIFAMIDESYQLAGAVLKAPFVAFKITVAKALGFEDKIPDTLGFIDWVGHVQKIFQYALLIFAALLNIPMELYNPGFTLGLARKIGFIGACDPQLTFSLNDSQPGVPSTTALRI